MISNFRKFAKSPWAVGLIGLIMLSFVIVGAQMDVFGAFGSRNVISAGSRSLDSQEFVQEFTRIRDSYAEQGQAVTFEDMVGAGLHQQYLEERTTELSFLDWAWNVGIRPARELVLKQIRAIPAFFNQLTGQFDEQAYAQALQQANVNPRMFEEYLADQFTKNHYSAAMMAGPRLPRIYGALIANQGLETRDARWFTVTQAMAGEAPQPTDAQLTAFMNENAAQLRRPELRTLSVVLFVNEGDRAAVTDAQIQEKFEFRRDSLSAPEKRTFVVLSAPNRAAADRIAAELRAGKSPAEAGQAAGVQPTDYVDTPRSGVADPAVAEAVFGLGVNQVSAPVQARVGFAVARVTAVTPGHEAQLADSRDAIIDELVKERVNQRVTDFMEAQQQGKSLADAAQQVGARIMTVGPVSQEGATAAGRINPPPQLLQTAWTLQKGEESEVVDAGGGQYFAVRVDDITPPAMPTLAEVREPLARQWRLRENGRRLTAKAEELSARIRNGEDIAAVAASAGASLTVRTGLEQTQETQDSIGEGAMRGVFSQERGQVFTLPSSDNAMVIGRVDAIHAPTAAAAAPVARQVAPRLLETVFGALTEQAGGSARERRRARYDAELAVQALGVTPPATPAPAQ